MLHNVSCLAHYLLPEEQAHQQKIVHTTDFMATKCSNSLNSASLPTALAKINKPKPFAPHPLP